MTPKTPNLGYNTPDAAAPQAIILAAGRGKRMGGDADGALPKVIYPVAGEPMVRWVVRACREAGVKRCILVIGFRGELVRQALADMAGCVFVEQTEQLGTGHATRMAEPLFAGQIPCDVFVLAGDGPLIRAQTLTALLQKHRSSGAAATLATAVIDAPTGYGRVLRSSDGGFDRIVEHKDATAQQRLIREINPSYYCFRSDALFGALKQLQPNNRQGEYYLTDAPAILKSQGLKVMVADSVPTQDVLSINTPAELAQVDDILRRRLRRSSTVGAQVMKGNV